MAFNEIMKKLSYLLKISLIFCFLEAQAQDQILQERDIFENAKGKKYEGGAEESELQVQVQLFKPQRKIAPVVEKTDDQQSSDRD
jgi:hypothetical protein